MSARERGRGASVLRRLSGEPGRSLGARVAHHGSRALILLGEVDLAREDWNDAIAHFDEALAIAERIGDSPIAFSIRSNLARALLELQDLDRAQPNLDAIALERPENTEVYRLQARMAWSRGNAARAAEFMTLARNGAGEAWSEDDGARLELYRTRN